MSVRNEALGISNLPEKTATIEEFIDMGDTDDITYSQFSILVKCIGENSIIQYAQDNIIYDYLEELKEDAVEYEFTDDEYVKYRYKPKLLAYDLYGSTEIYFVIMALNGMCNIKDFNKRKLKLLYRSRMIELLNEIYSAESDYIKYNRLHLNDQDEE